MGLCLWLCFQVIIGGGRRYMTPRGTKDPEYPQAFSSRGKRKDGRNLINEWQSMKTGKVALFIHTQCYYIASASGRSLRQVPKLENNVMEGSKVSNHITFKGHFFYVSENCTRCQCVKVVKTYFKDALTTDPLNGPRVSMVSRLCVAQRLNQMYWFGNLCFERVVQCSKWSGWLGVDVQTCCWWHQGPKSTENEQTDDKLKES